MDTQTRDNLIAAIAGSRTDNASAESLADYFYQGQVESLDELSDDELLEISESL